MQDVHSMQQVDHEPHPSPERDLCEILLDDHILQSTSRCLRHEQHRRPSKPLIPTRGIHVFKKLTAAELLRNRDLSQCLNVLSLCQQYLGIAVHDLNLLHHDPSGSRRRKLAASLQCGRIQDGVGILRDELDGRQVLLPSRGPMWRRLLFNVANRICCRRMDSGVFAHRMRRHRWVHQWRGSWQNDRLGRGHTGRMQKWRKQRIDPLRRRCVRRQEHWAVCCLDGVELGMECFGHETRGNNEFKN
mmetsp:Transcript_8447/g.24210  ORF Transcript_8447/g.24210 Transcript_8447/m.24210 type:complete len:245 (-) Transcript_8447:98-832(-)